MNELTLGGRNDPINKEGVEYYSDLVSMSFDTD